MAMRSQVLSPDWSAGDARYSALKAIIDEITNCSDSYMSMALGVLMQRPEIRKHIDGGVMPYLYAAGLLSFAGREITDESLSKLLKVIGVKPDRKLLDIIMESGVKSHLVYIYSFYFLLSSHDKYLVFTSTIFR